MVNNQISLTHMCQCKLIMLTQTHICKLVLRKDVWAHYVGKIMWEKWCGGRKLFDSCSCHNLQFIKCNKIRQASVLSDFGRDTDYPSRTLAQRVVIIVVSFLSVCCHLRQQYNRHSRVIYRTGFIASKTNIIYPYSKKPSSVRQD